MKWWWNTGELNGCGEEWARDGATGPSKGSIISLIIRDQLHMRKVYKLNNSEVGRLGDIWFPNPQMHSPCQTLADQ